MSEDFDWPDDLNPRIPEDSYLGDDVLCPADHIADGSEVTFPERALLMLETWDRRGPGAVEAGDFGDALASIVGAKERFFYGVAARFDTIGAFNAGLATIRTNDADPRLRCLTWMQSVDDFISEALIPSLSGELNLHGQPTIYIPTAGKLVYLAWRGPADGDVVALDTLGGPCRQCFGCKSVEPNREHSPVSWVYFIQSTQGGPVKIGYSTNPAGRLSTLQTAHAHPLKIIGRMPGGLAVERSLHTLFAADRVRSDGEWFRPSVALLAFIQEVGGAG